MPENKAEVAHKALQLAVGSILADGGDAAEIVECFKQFHEFLGGQESEMTKDEIAKLVAEAVAAELEKLGDGKPLPKKGGKDKGKPAPDAQNNDDDDAQKALEKVFGVERAAEIVAEMAKEAEKAEKAEETPVVEKAVDSEIAKRDAEIVDLRKAVNDLREAGQKVEFGKRAVAIGLTEAEGEKLRKAYAGDVESLKFLEETIGKLHVQVNKGALFTEVGSGVGAGGTITAHDELKAKALDLRKANPKLTEAQAYVEAMSLYPEVAKRESDERQNKIFKMA